MGKRKGGPRNKKKVGQLGPERITVGNTIVMKRENRRYYEINLFVSKSKN